MIAGRKNRRALRIAGLMAAAGAHRMTFVNRVTQSLRTGAHHARARQRSPD